MTEKSLKEFIKLMDDKEKAKIRQKLYTKIYGPVGIFITISFFPLLITLGLLDLHSSVSDATIGLLGLCLFVSYFFYFFSYSRKKDKQVKKNFQKEMHRLWLENSGTHSENKEKTAAPPRRKMIPREIREKVWQLDGGQCRLCGAQKELQIDHIIPVSKGGGIRYRICKFFVALAIGRKAHASESENGCGRRWSGCWAVSGSVSVDGGRC